MDSDLPLSGRSRRIVIYNGFWSSVQDRLSICSDSVATQFARSRSIVKQRVFLTSKQNRLSIPGDPASLHVGSPHRSGKKVVVGICLVDIRFAIARVRIHWKKHNGLWPPSQNQLCFTGRRDCATATCKTQWILTRRAESLVFFNGSWTRLLPTSILVFKPFFFRICWMCGAIRLVLFGNDECIRDSAPRGGHFYSFIPEFVAPLSWNGRSSKCRLPLNVFPQLFC